jgi:hypothetical protein
MDLSEDQLAKLAHNFFIYDGDSTLGRPELVVCTRCGDCWVRVHTSSPTPAWHGPTRECSHRFLSYDTPHPESVRFVTSAPPGR